MNEFLSVILPTYNEEDNIVPLIESIKKELEGYHYEIVVIDDDSRDKTFEKVSQLQGQYVKVIQRKENKGLANSVRCGIENSKGNTLIIMDSDFNHKPEYLRKMIETGKASDCVLASRFLPGGGMHNKIRYNLSSLFNVFIRFMTRGKLTDYLFGFILVRRDILRAKDFNFIFHGFGDYCMRLLVCMERRHLNIVEIPAFHGERKGGKSGNKLWLTFFKYTIETLKLAISRVPNNV